MSDRHHRTDTILTYKTIQVGETAKYWLEFQLVDERGEPLPHQPYRAINEATRCQLVPEFNGQSDAQGVIRLEGLHPLAVTLLLTANPLAEVLQTRRLRALRAELPVSTPLQIPYRYNPPPAGFSPLQKQAWADGHEYHYLRIGQLCDRFPDLNPAWTGPHPLPAFHFPDPEFSGLTVHDERLNRRHVLEICPFRAWSLVLHHQPEYSMANAYNLGLMANLSYSNVVKKALEIRPDEDPSAMSGSVEEFFFRQCLDLSRTPMMIDANSTQLPALVVDVPFDQRYTTAVMLDSLTAELPAGSAIPWRIIENTQLLYVINQTQVVVAWRGTQELKDWLTDLMYRPVATDGSGSDLKAPGTALTGAGSVHYGFLQAFEVAKTRFADRFSQIENVLDERNLFICGHSLGGALALIHSAELKERNPILYTYGMPRTFTGKAIERLQDVTHFRHVNDADTITSVPPEAALDNWLYDALGPLGSDLGYVWSVGQLLAGKLVRFGDPYWHHGQLVMFYRADQHLSSQGSSYPAYRNKDGLGAPYHNTITRRLPHRTRIYLVPSLNDEFSRFAFEEQKVLIRSLNRENLARFLPSHTNPERSNQRSNPMDHSMIRNYLPFLHNQLLELSDPERPLERKDVRAQFEQQMQMTGIPEPERHRNEQFLALQKLLPMALRMTQDLEGGPEALQRFCREREFGVMIEVTQPRACVPAERDQAFQPQR